jgi:Holliday junction resolvasome RuvABC endonuclease subunit
MGKQVLYIDPASISSGWALFEDGVLINSGTIAVDKKDNVFIRLCKIYKSYRKVPKVGEVHIEQLVRNTHIYTHWSVSVIAIALHHSGCNISADIPIASWQKYTDWQGKKAPLHSYTGRVKSEDELAAIGMGLWHTARTAGGGIGKRSRRKR